MNHLNNNKQKTTTTTKHLQAFAIFFFLLPIMKRRTVKKEAQKLNKHSCTKGPPNTISFVNKELRQASLKATYRLVCFYFGRKRERHRQTDRQRRRQIDRQTATKTDRQRRRQRQRMYVLLTHFAVMTL